jgi:superfamily II DNA or RNA helicase
MPFTAGDRVVVRRRKWVVEQVTAFADATLLDLSGADDDARRHRCRLLAPFDRPVPIDRRPRIRAVTRRRWMHRLNRHRSELCRSGDLRAAAGAAIDVLPFQLEPALALVRGHGSRFLLADEVGLGKTIQAGLMLAELRQRGWCEHALIVTPAGLRHQWAEELRRRFDMDAAIVDAASLAASTSTLPFDVNPWDVEPISITSVDFLKQPEVLRGVGTRVWDVLIVDEAHQATTPSLRYEAVQAVAKRARHVILVTATPHAGDERAYRALCAIGEIGENDPALLFRRTRERTGQRRSRRVHLLPVALTQDGVALHRLLNLYLARLWSIMRESGRHDVGLVAMVLAKRAFSCTRSLVATLERRLAALVGNIGEPAQSSLPFGFEDDRSDDGSIPVAPAFDRTADERESLERLIEAARRAQAGDRKLHALRRIVRRVREPLIVFTEYRDTLDAIREEIADIRTIATLHGGQSPQERSHSVCAFTTGEADVLLATDAGSEGLNLQTNCRLVVNLELPWNPTRLEQRIGRVDRIGQTRTVHAINLFADGTAERTVLASLLRRIDRIRLSEIEIAACVIGHAALPPPRVPAETSTRTVSLELESRTAAQHVADVRILSARQSKFPEGVVPVTTVRSCDTALIFVFRTRVATASGRVLEERLVPIRLPLPGIPRCRRRKEVRALAEGIVERCGADVLCEARAHAVELARGPGHGADPSLAAALRRERALLANVAADRASLVQAGLFDNRALKEKHAEEERSHAMRLESDTRSRALDTDATSACAADPELVMLLFLCSGA